MILEENALREWTKMMLDENMLREWSKLLNGQVHVTWMQALQEGERAKELVLVKAGTGKHGRHSSIAKVSYKWHRIKHSTTFVYKHADNINESIHDGMRVHDKAALFEELQTNPPHSSRQSTRCSSPAQFGWHTGQQRKPHKWSVPFEAADVFGITGKEAVLRHRGNYYRGSTCYAA